MLAVLRSATPGAAFLFLRGVKGSGQFAEHIETGQGEDHVKRSGAER